MTDFDLISAWAAWFSADNSNGTIADGTLYGLSLFWLGRLGKIVGFLSAITIILEIIGPERVRNSGRTLLERAQELEPGKWTKAAVDIFSTITGMDIKNSQFTIAQTAPPFPIKDHTKNILLGLLFPPLLILVGITYIAHQLRYDSRWQLVAFSIPVGTILSILVLLASLSFFISSFWGKFEAWEWIVYSIALLAVWILLLPPMFIGGLLLVGAVLWIRYKCAVFLNAAVIRPLAWTLGHPRLETSIKITSGVLLLLGFHFDLLTS